MKITCAVAMISVLIWISAVAKAEIFAVSPSEMERNMVESFGSVARRKALSPKEEWAAIAFASGWVYLGPCQGDSRKLEHSPEIISIVMSIDYGTPLGSAILEMIALMTIADFGKKPQEITCEYALKRAQSTYKYIAP